MSDGGWKWGGREGFQVEGFRSAMLDAGCWMLVDGMLNADWQRHFLGVHDWFIR